MLLGTLIEQLSVDTDAARALEALNDVVLFAEIDKMARRFGETPPEYVAASASRFAAMANDEEWLALMNAMERAPDPAQAVLVRMVRWGLNRDATDIDQAGADAKPSATGCSCG